jgi:hypothetical protein
VGACKAGLRGFGTIERGIAAGKCTYFQLVLKEVFFVGEFAIKAEESLFVCREGLVEEKVEISMRSSTARGEAMLTLMSILFFW